MYTQPVRFQNLFPETLHYGIKKTLDREINLEPCEKWIQEEIDWKKNWLVRRLLQ